MPVASVILGGFKSFRDRIEIPLGDLTVLAGANSSGKSTIMQTLLLMKQTLESGFDPGPLLISGPNAIFSSTEQMFWSAPGDRKEEITLGLKVTGKYIDMGYEVQLTRQKGSTAPLQIAQATTHAKGVSQTRRFQITAEEREQLIEKARKNWGRRWSGQSEDVDFNFERERDRFFLYTRLKLINPKNGAVQPGGLLDEERPQFFIEQVIRGMIHVPGLRGNPRRTYPVTAVERNFPGLFPDYVASVIAFWQETDVARTKQISEDLKTLGLTWSVKARRLSDTEVEILVGRLPKSIKHGARDTVSIADVGFGLSQSLPVVVALLAAEPGELVYLEQPEIHLHPRAEYQLSRLIQRAVKRGVQVVVETHSELLLLGLQELVAKQEFGEHSVILHWVQRDQRGASLLASHTLDKKGGWGDVPVDFAHVSLEAMNNYLNAIEG